MYFATVCPSNMIPVQCASCPKVCQSDESECVESSECNEGCECPPNKILYQGNCIEAYDCTCKDNRGIIREVCFINHFKLYDLCF